LGEQIKKDGLGEVGGRYGKERCIQGLVGKPEGKRPLGRHMHRLKDIIKMDIKEIGWKCGLN
jgi:hypothetical protein